MAERRMMSKKIVDSDAFMDMPLSAQSLYFHLLMRADDDGFVGNPRKIMRMINANDDDYKLIMAKRFVLVFESGVCVIKHWLIHNYIQNDRYSPSQYIEEKNALIIKENKSYTECIQNVSTTDTQYRLGKVSIGKDSIEAKGFTRPTLEEIKQYCTERNNDVSAERFLDYYQSNGWKVGRNSMKDWKATIRTWEKNELPKSKVPRTFIAKE